MLPLALNTPYVTQRFTTTRAGTIASPRFSAQIALVTPQEFTRLVTSLNMPERKRALDSKPVDKQVHCQDSAWTGGARFCTVGGFFIPGQRNVSLLHMNPLQYDGRAVRIFGENELYTREWESKLRNSSERDVAAMTELGKKQQQTSAPRGFYVGGSTHPKTTGIGPIGIALEKMTARASSSLFSSAKEIFNQCGIKHRRSSHIWGSADIRTASNVIILPEYNFMALCTGLDNKTGASGFQPILTIEGLLKHFHYIKIAKGDVLVGTDGEIVGPFRKGHPTPKATKTRKVKKK